MLTPVISNCFGDFCRRCGISVFSHLSWQGEERYLVNLGCLEGFDLFSMADLPVNDGASY